MGSIATEPAIEVSSKDRVEPGSFPLKIAKYPSASTSEKVDADALAARWVESFNKSITNPELASISALFLSESYWRDQLCLSWDFHTLLGPQNILELLQKSKNGSRIKSITLDKSSALRSPQTAVLDADGKVHVVQAFLTVETDIGSGAGLVRLVKDEDGDEWKAFTLFTFLSELKGFEECVGRKRPNGVEHGEHLSRKNWLDKRNSEENFEDGEEPTVLILGN